MKSKHMFITGTLMNGQIAFGTEGIRDLFRIVKGCRILFSILAWSLFMVSCGGESSLKRSEMVLPDQNISTDSLLKLVATYKAAPKDRYVAHKTAVVILLLEGAIASRRGDYEIAQRTFSTAIELIGQQYDTLLMANALKGLGDALKNKSAYSEALIQYKKSLNLYQSLNDILSSANLHANISQVFQLKNDISQSENHILSGLHLLENDTNSVSYLILLHTLANVYGMQNKFSEALALDEQGLRISRAINRPEYGTPFLDNKANCFLYSNRLDSAAFYFNQCLVLDTANKKQLSDTWLNLGILEKKKGNLEKSISNFNQSLKFSTATAYAKGQMQALQELSGVYRSGKNYYAALDAQTRYYQLKDSVQNIQKEKAIEEWKIVYETETKDKTIQLNQLTIQKKNITIIGIVIICILLFSGFWLQNRRRKILHHKDMERAVLDREQQAIIDILSAEERERKRIAEDLHDGLGQSLTAVWLQLQSLRQGYQNAPETNGDIGVVIERVTHQVESCCTEARLLSHNLIPDILLERGLKSALHKLIANIDSNVLMINLDYTLEYMQLSKISQLLVYRIIQECISNVLKHAHASELDLCICQEGKHIAVLIEDNGVGFKASDGYNATGIGMQNIISRVQSLHGSVEWNSTLNQGTVITLYIPLSNGI